MTDVQRLINRTTGVTRRNTNIGRRIAGRARNVSRGGMGG